MSGSDQESGGERPEASQPPRTADEPETSPGEPRKKSPLFRMSRLDGRDTLKYEDTADK